jgi:nucleoside 2-deoxyribosyltransferase
MKVIYIAGKYRDEFPYLIWDHITTAREQATLVWQMGAVALCPHMNSMFLEGAASADAFIEGTLELMRRCDAVLVCPNYESSVGTRGEIAEATKLGKPVFYRPEELLVWLRQST